MSDAFKSAYEIAMEKLRQQDKARGDVGPGALTDAQKRAIAESRAKAQARLAEVEILHRDNRLKAAEDADALAKLEEQYQIDRRRIEDQREREIVAARAGTSGPAADKTSSPGSGKPSGAGSRKSSGSGAGGKAAPKRKGKGGKGAASVFLALLAGGLHAEASAASAAAAAPAATAAPAPGAAPAARSIVLRAARLFDGGDGPLRQDVAVVVEGELIKAVGEAGAIDIPPGARVIDLGDVTLLPGLIDAHTHVLLQGDPTRHSYEDQLLKESIPHRTVRAVAAARTALQHGFTTLRDLGSEGAGYADVALRDGILEGQIPGPRLYVSTLALDITGAYPLQGFALEAPVPGGVQFVDGPDAGRRAVREQVKHGTDWIKIYCDRSYFIGPDGRLDSIPTFEPDELRAIVDEAHRQNRKVAAHAMAPKGIQRALDVGADSIEHGIGLNDAVIRSMLEHKVSYCPTLMVTEYVAPARVKEGSPVWERVPELHRASFKAAVDAGVTIVFGTDAGGFPWTMNEAEEFVWMVRFGMAPAAALRSATSVAARLLGQEKEIGRVAEGYRADLVAVPGDPLKRIEAMQEVGFVMQGGRVVVTGGGTVDAGLLAGDVLETWTGS